MKRTRERESTISVYGQVTARKVQRVKAHTRAGVKVRSYRRTVTVREQRRWDFKGSRRDLGRAVAHVKRTRAAPKIRHKRIRADTFLKRPEKWSDRWELEAPDVDSPNCSICGRRCTMRGGRLYCPRHGRVS